MITCPKCFKENQDHYKFCLGCGAELPREASPKKFASGTPPHGMPATRAAGVGVGNKAESTTMGTGIAAQVRALAEAAPPPPLGGADAKPATAADAKPATAAEAKPGATDDAKPGAAAEAKPAPATDAKPVVSAAPRTAAAPVAPPPPAAAATSGPAPSTGAAGATPVPPKPAAQPFFSPSGAPPPATKPSADVVAGLNPCPQCSQPNQLGNKFCASCGFKLTKPPPASTPGAELTPAAPAASGAILTALRADGTEAGSYPLPAGVALIGRDTGAIFAGDNYLSPRHATFTAKAGKLSVKDEGSLNGVYRKLRREEPVTVNFGDVFRIGQEIVRFEPLAPLPATVDGVERLGSPSKGYVGRIAMIIGRDATGNAFPVPEMGLHLGRERGDVLFPEDGYVSGLHCRIAWQNGQLYLTDLGSSNGTFLRLASETEVHNGDILLMGQQLFRVTI